MASTIDPTKPIAGNPTTASVRAQFAAAVVDIDALQAADLLLAPKAGPTFTGLVTVPSLKLDATTVTATGAELNILDGVTATAAELNILDGVTSTAAELNILDGVTSTAAELNYNDITTLGTAQASKAVTVSAGNVATLTGVTLTGAAGINSSPVGAGGASTGAFTTLSTTGAITQAGATLANTYVALTAAPNANLVINGNFTVNQRSAGAKAQATGVYGYDRWKGGAAGFLEQVIEYSGVATTVTLSWVGGTGNGSVNGGTAGTSPVTDTVTAETNFSVIVPDDATQVKCEVGSIATPYVARLPGEELALCQRYYQLVQEVALCAYSSTATAKKGSVPFSVQMRAVPTVTGSLVGATSLVSQGVSVTGIAPYTTSPTADNTAYQSVTASAEL